VIFFIIPNIKSYKISKYDLSRVNKEITTFTKEEKELKENLKLFKHSNNHILEKFHRDFNEAKFINDASKYLTNIKLIKLKRVDKIKSFDFMDYDEYNLTASTKIKSPKDFFKFINSLKDYNNVIKINFPIVLVSKDKQIDIKMIIDIYKTIKN
jgi:hypothetical protein